jgi:hypothetical protein
MPYTTTYNAADNIIETRISGVVTMEVIRSGLEDIMRLSLEHDCFSWLNDFSDAQLDIPLYQLSQYAESVPLFLVKIGDKRFKIKRAIVKNDQDEGFFFFENASVNRGVNTRIFPDSESAKKWLLG